MRALTLGVVQTTTGLDAAVSAAGLADAVTRLAGAGAGLVLTPEMSGRMDRDRPRMLASAAAEADDVVLTAIARAAAAASVHVLIGSLAIRSEREPGRIANRALLVGPDGAVAARYDKLHLFDVDLGEGERFAESRSCVAGDAAVVHRAPWGAIGLSICYDLRFPALYAALATAGAEILAVPSAFTPTTGAVHWETLVRARAIETGAFVVAPAQTGRHADGRSTHGHSLVVDPQGRVRLDMGTAPGEALVTIDLDEVAAARARIPNLAHARPIEVTVN